jgi:hypothetical protein
MPRDHLDPKQPLDIEPDADRNVERITDCCLDVRGKSAYLLGRGRGGGAWWMIWMGMMMTTGVLLLLIIGGYWKYGISWKILTNAGYILLTVSLPCCAIFGLSLLWPIHVWKTHLPLRFNRKTRKVYFHWKGKTYVENWDEIGIYTKAQFSVNAMGAPFHDPHINVEFHNEDGSTFTVFLMGVENIDLTTEQSADAFWEYIRRYMEEGPEKLPTPDQFHEFKDDAMKEIREMYNIFPIWNPGVSLMTKVFGILIILPITLIWSAISFPTEILYYHLEKRIKTNPFPPDMEEACHCKKSIKVWYPKPTNQEAA